MANQMTEENRLAELFKIAYSTSKYGAMEKHVQEMRKVVVRAPDVVKARTRELDSDLSRDNMNCSYGL